ncbi:hypothetical protein [Stenotrophomonas maltophilia]|uniref:hypothetical protein n=1 Tax=Stenotrophomonas maltophilia TaxID=40324 RepID=UPI00201CCE9D|nr:hypothetical protein [Stenotrophomonas maltophilia]UQY97362.1 hypothetical protein LZ605_08370 [Stenotrophomonas maltophilia]
MTDSVVVDFQHEPEFAKKENGELPRIELIREQVAGFVSGYTTAKGNRPPRIVLQSSDLKHCVRRILARMQKPHRAKAKAEWQEKRKAGSTQPWRDAKPEPIPGATLTWCGIPIEGMGYSRHRAVDKH